MLWSTCLLPATTVFSQGVSRDITYLDSLGEFYFLQEQLDSSAYYHQKALELADQQQDLSAHLNAYNWLFVIRYYQGATDSMAALIERMTPLADRIQPSGPKDFEVLSSFWGYKSFFHYSRGELAQNVTAVRRSLELYEMQPEIDTSELAIKYQNLGISLEEIGAYDQAHTYSLKALDLLRPSKMRLQIGLDSLNIITSLGVQMIRLKRYAEAEDFFQQGTGLATAFSKSRDGQGISSAVLYYLQRGSNFYFQKEHEQAEQQFQLAQKILDRQQEISDLAPQLQRYRARNALDLGKTDQARSWVAGAQELIERNFSDRPDQIAATQEIRGEVEQAQHNYPEAIAAYQLAMTSLCPGFQPTASTENPDFEQIQYSKNDLLRLLQKKASCQQEAGRDSEAFTTFQLAVRLFHRIREDYLTEESRLFLSEFAVPLFAGAAQTAIKLGRESEAFSLIEHSKALLLQEGLKEEEAYELAGVPTAWSGQMQELQIAQTYWDRMRYDAAYQQDDTARKEAEDELFRINKERFSLQEKIRKSYPEFFELKFGGQAVDLATIARELPNPETALIEYFVTDDQVLLFGISREEQIIRILDKTDDFTTVMNRLLNALHVNSSSQPDQYAEDALAVYQQYLAPVLEGFRQPVTSLYIVPDGLFSYLPFEALLTEAPAENAYSTFPYLIRQYQCSYAYSATLLVNSRTMTPGTGRNFVGFAPQFSSGSEVVAQRADLGPLRYNVSAVEAIHQLTGGTAYTRDQATREQLLHPSMAPLVLHLSTHARMDDQDPMGSKIYLADGDIATREIYHFPYSCQMVVLSACETGTGKYYKGEGMMSLARAFMQSGSPSVVTSLWRVDDRSTGELMVHFYQHLIDGNNKDDAIRQAKLAYLSEKESEMLHHPYYWAAFIHIGDPTAIPFSGSALTWKWLILLLAGGGLFYFLSKRRDQ